MRKLDKTLEQKISANQQEHLLKFINEIDDKQFESYVNQLKQINWDELQNLINKYIVTNNTKTQIDEDEILPAPYYPLIPQSSQEKDKYKKARLLGEKLIQNGKVALLTVAGGQGTRLGFDAPKGTYQITPVKGKSFFQYFAEKIIRAGEKFHTDFFWMIMTSPVNHQQTISFFEKNNYFNLNKNSVFFFSQGTMPAFSTDGKILIESKSSLALSPDGHGGLINALSKSGLLDILERKGVNIISYFQIDNILAPFLDTLFIGLHQMDDSDMSSRMLPKTDPYEKLGNFCIIKNKLCIIEYSDMPDHLAKSTNPDGSLKFIAGSPAIHLFKLDFLKQLANPSNPLKLPWHRALKKVPFIDNSGSYITPDKPNAVKLEKFIFDALPLADKTLILEAERNKSFAPVKNPTGIDSVESARKLLSNRDAEWLENAGIKIPKDKNNNYDCIIELSPLKYYDFDDVKANIDNFKTPKPKERVYFE